jgi:CRP/FNR family transcriptional regulator
MIGEKDRPRVTGALALLGRLEPDMASEFMQAASLARFPVGRDLLAEGERVDAVPVLVSGRVRVYRIGATGREITLYRFSQGECCVLSADSILGNRLFPANAQVEESAEVAFVPASIFDRWLARSAAWRRFVFEALSRRVVSLVDTVDDVAFRRMDVRVAQLLVRRSGGRQGTVAITHQAIADELGSSREVVSRILEDLQARGQIRLSRGAVELLAPAVLKDSSRA